MISDSTLQLAFKKWWLKEFWYKDQKGYENTPPFFVRGQIFYIDFNQNNFATDWL